MFSIRNDAVEIDSEYLSSDVDEFRQLLSIPGQKESPEKKEKALDAAERLYRGLFMEGFTLPDCPDFDTWELFQEELFRRQFTAILGELITFKAERSQWIEAIRLGRRLIELDPLEESSHRLLMEILAAAGHRGEALRQYEECARFLRSELGEEPESATTALKESLHESTHTFEHTITTLTAAEREASEPLISLLPEESNSFVGRKEELKLIRSLMQGTTRLLTLTGPAGSGKTRLAVRAARSLSETFPGGIVFVDLARVHKARDVPAAIAGALGLQESFPSKEEALRIVGQRLNGTAVLLLLDNYEHLLEAADFTAGLLEYTHRTACLVTSREPLHVADEWTLPIPPLDFRKKENKESETLFLERARSALGEKATASLSREKLTSVCRLLDGLPLAIELAVPLLRIFTLEELEQRLAAPLDYLETSRPSCTSRHASLQRAIDGSFRLLTNTEAQLLASLGIFTGGFTLETVHRVCTAGWENRCTAKTLQSLIEKSLVHETELSCSGSRRFSLLESVRHYAIAKANALDLTAGLQKRHADFFTNLIHTRFREFYGTQEEQALGILTEEHANIQSTLDFLNAGEEYVHGLQLAVELNWYWYRRGMFGTGEYWLSCFLEKFPARPIAESKLDLPRSRGIESLAWMKLASGYWRRAYLLYTEALEASRLSGDTEIEARSLSGVGVTARWLGDVKRGTEYTEEAIRVARTQDNQVILLHTLIWAYATTGGSFTGTPPVAQLHEAADLARKLGSRWYYAHVLNGLGDLFSTLGSFVQAKTYFLLSLREYSLLGDRMMMAWNEEGLGLLAYRDRALNLAHTHTARALSYFHTVGDELNFIVMLVRLADIQDCQGRQEEAAQCAGAASRVIDAINDTDAGRSPRIAHARRRCAQYESRFPLAWIEGRETPLHEILSRIGCSE